VTNKCVEQDFKPFTTQLIIMDFGTVLGCYVLQSDSVFYVSYSY